MRFRLVHQTSCCPFRFDFAHNSRAAIRKWALEYVGEFLKTTKLRVDSELSAEYPHHNDSHLQIQSQG